MQNLLEFKSELFENLGASYNPNFGSTPIDGYMISVRPEIKTTLLSIPINEAIQKIIGDYCIELQNENYFLGGWIDKGVCYFDLSFNTQSLPYAIELGILNHQLAIFDVANKVCIDLPKPQTTGTETQKVEYARQQAIKIISILNQ